MTSVLVAHQLLLFLHLMIFALAISEVVGADLRMLRSRRLDPHWLRRISRRILILLALLWVSGAMLLAMSGNANPTALLTNPKLATKLLAVTVLTLNGVLLHTIAFPTMLRGGRIAALASVLGAISTGSWLYASFVGVSRVIAPEMTLVLYLGIYGFVVSGGVGIALVLVRPHVRQMLRATAAASYVGVPDGPDGPRAVSSSPAMDSPHFRVHRLNPGVIALSIGALLLGTLLSGLPMGR
jgi:hypothetical protein